MRLIRSILFYIGFFAIFIIGTLAIIFLTIVRKNKRKEIAYKISKIWAKSILFIAGVKIFITGVENLSINGPSILICNHQGNFDIPILMASLPINFKFLAKKELFAIPIFGWHLKNRGDVSIDRKNPLSASKTIVDLSKNLKNSEPIVIFPEGTRSYDGKISNFKKGSILLALETKANIIPIGISGSFNIQKRGSLFISPANVKVNIGKSLKLDKDCQDIEQISELLKDKISNLVN